MEIVIGICFFVVSAGLLEEMIKNKKLTEDLERVKSMLCDLEAKEIE